MITDWIQAIAILVLIGVTWWYAKQTKEIAIATHKQAEATKQQAEASNKMIEQELKNACPIVTPSIGWFDLALQKPRVIIKNHGPGAALDIEITVVNSRLGTRQKTFRTDSRLSVLEPGAEWRDGLSEEASADSDTSKYTEKPLKTEVRYRSAFGMKAVVSREHFPEKTDDGGVIFKNGDTVISFDRFVPEGVSL